mmetsp:Transcript_42894/g.79476  ORF Transcript_42894/g.79476 Transcript_42894/m.79476 type:complete len:231 (+) Transcript_42894:405-1097(+)
MRRHSLLVHGTLVLPTDHEVLRSDSVREGYGVGRLPSQGGARLGQGVLPSLERCALRGEAPKDQEGLAVVLLWGALAAVTLLLRPSRSVPFLLPVVLRGRRSAVLGVRGGGVAQVGKLQSQISRGHPGARPSAPAPLPPDGSSLLRHNLHYFDFVVAVVLRDHLHVHVRIVPLVVLLAVVVLVRVATVIVVVIVGPVIRSGHPRRLFLLLGQSLVQVRSAAQSRRGESPD